MHNKKGFSYKLSRLVTSVRWKKSIQGSRMRNEKVGGRNEPRILSCVTRADWGCCWRPMLTDRLFNNKCHRSGFYRSGKPVGWEQGRIEQEYDDERIWARERRKLLGITSKEYGNESRIISVGIQWVRWCVRKRGFDSVAGSDEVRWSFIVAVRLRRFRETLMVFYVPMIWRCKHVN